MPPRPRPPIVRAVRSPEAMDALLTWLDACDPGARQRGRDYFQSRAVLKVWSDADHLVKAEVEGGTRYAVVLFFTRGAWSGRCTCPVGQDCKHAYASALAWQAVVEAGIPDGRDPAEAAALSAHALPPPLSTAATPAPPTAQPSPLEAELSAWLRFLPDPEAAAPHRATPPPGPLANVAGLRLRLAENGRWLIETRPTADRPWKSAPKRLLTDLARARPADLTSLTPAEAALAVALAAEFRLEPYSLDAQLDPGPVSHLLRTPSALGAIARPDGSPFTIEPAPLVPQASPTLDDAEQLDLHLATPEGRDASAARLVIPAPTPLYLFENRVWRGPPPLPPRSLPVAALRDPRLRPRLRAVGLRLPDHLVDHSRLVSLRPRLRCWLTDLPDGLEREFRAQLTARADDPPCERAWTGSDGWRWTKTGATAPRPADAPVTDFDLAAATAAASSLAGLRLGWDGWSEHWARAVTDDFPDEFLAWHRTLPADLDVELSPELAGLFGAPLHASLAVDIAPASDSPRDWFDLSVNLQVADSTLSAEEVALLLKARGKWVRLARHGWRRAESTPELDTATAAALDRLGLAVHDVAEAGRGARHRLHALQLALEAESLAARDQVLAHVLQDRVRTLAATPPAPLPEGLRAELRPYQKEGYQFLCHLSAQGFGGVLADDMGLGKTVQTLAWLLRLAAEISNLKSEISNGAEGANGAFRALVVCPKSVTHGWLAETARFAPGLSIAAFSASPADRPALAAAHLVVANYTQLRLHAARFRSESWDAVVLDEGQFIKNPSSQVAIAARSLRARRRLVLTGTPIENRLADLWSLFAFAQPGLLGDQPAFRRQYPEQDPAALARLHRRVRHFLLRRTKAQAAPDLPPRTEDEIIVELEGEQRRLYDAELKRARAQLLGVDTKSALDAVRFHVLASLLRLRQICCHPALIDPAHAHLPSAKLDALLERIEELADEGHQVLVFSQFVEMLHLIRDRLASAGIGHLLLTGATENRAALVDSFQTDPSKTVFLLSLKAAGFGLNLTAASYAFLYDPWWNPAAEAQAIDRIHRIGQTKPVIAYRLLAQDSIEEKIRLLQREKAALAAAVVQEESLTTVLDLDSLRQILG